MNAISDEQCKKKKKMKKIVEKEENCVERKILKCRTMKISLFKLQVKLVTNYVC